MNDEERCRHRPLRRPSARMGRPKAWLPFGGEFMLPRVVRLLSEAVSPIIVVASPGQESAAAAGRTSS